MHRAFIVILLMFVTTTKAQSEDVGNLSKNILHEPISIAISEDHLSQCYLNNYVVGKSDDDDSSLEFFTQHIVPWIVGALAIFGFFLSLYTSHLQIKFRKQDQNRNEISFWLKDVVFPTYIEPLVNQIKEADSLLHALKQPSNLTEDEIDEMFTRWDIVDKNIVSIANFGSHIPHFKDTFLHLSSKWSNLNERYLRTLYDDDLAIFSVGDAEVDGADMPKHIGEHEYSAAQEILSSIYKHISVISQQ